MWISLILEKRIIWQKCERRGSRHFCCGLGIKSRSKSKSSETKWEKAYRPLGLLLVLAIE
jgi:hypothetical protein